MLFLDNSSHALPIPTRIVGLDYDLSKSIIGLYKPGVNLKITPSGWSDMHYVIEENLVTGEVDFRHLDTSSVLDFLKTLPGWSNQRNQVATYNYLHSPQKPTE